MPITACKFDSCPGHNHQAPMAELVDAYVSGAYIERCAGSTPVRGTPNIETLIDYQSVRVFLFLVVTCFDSFTNFQIILRKLPWFNQKNCIFAHR